MITLITPVLNNADTIGDCLASIQRQTLSCEHIIIDGGSTDGTLDIVDQQKLTDAKLISEPDQGMYDAINKGLTMATGDVVGILNADDFFPHKQVLEKVFSTFTERGIDATYGDLLYVDRENTHKIIRTWRSGEYSGGKFYAGWMPPHPTFYLKRSIYEELGGYRLDLGTAADYELMLRMVLRHGVVLAYIPDVLVHMRNKGMSNANLISHLMANKNDRKAWSVNGLRPHPWTVTLKPISKLIQWL